MSSGAEISTTCPRISFDGVAGICYDKNMPIIVEKNMRQGVRDVSRMMGINEKEFARRAVLLYLESAKKILDLENEFRAWDALSDEAYRAFSRRL